MNILKQELKSNWKPFLIWVMGIAFLIIGGMVKFNAVRGSGEGMFSGMMEQIPKPVLVIFGMSEGNIETLGGYYSVLEYYVMIVASCYAVALGCGSVLRESIDKTYEFLYTKPCGRTHILVMKMSAGFIFLTLLCLLNTCFSLLAPEIYGIHNSITKPIFLFSLSIWLVAVLFFVVSAFLAVAVKKVNLATQLGYGAVLLSYVFALLFDIDEKFNAMRFLTPFKYFRVEELLAGVFPYGFAAAIIIMVMLAFSGTLLLFQKKDLIAI